MRTGSPTPENSRSIAAAALLAMSKTPPQEVAIGCKILTTPENLERSSSTSSTPISIRVSKVSNSDDEGMGVQARAVHHNTSADKNNVPVPLRGILDVEDCLPEIPERLSKVNSSFWAASAPNAAGASEANSAPLYKSPYTMNEKERARTSPFVARASGPSFPMGGCDSAQKGSQALPRSRLPSSIPPGIIDNLLGPVSSSVKTRDTHLPSQRSVSLQQISQAPYMDGTMHLFPHCMMNESRHMSRPPLRAKTMLPTFNFDAGGTQPAHQISVGDAIVPSACMGSTTHLRLVLGDENVPGPALSEGAGVRRKVQIPCASFKHAMTPPSNNAAKRQKGGFELSEVDITDFKHRTIKAISMPTRDDLTPGQVPPVPTPETFPYGDDVDYKNSMLVYWLDEKELTYTESARRYRLKFRGETATDDTIRKKHHLILIKLARRYGLKPEDELEEPSKSVARRGQHAGRKYNTIGGRVVYAAGAGPEVAVKARQKRVTEPTADRGFLKACICVWKDTSNVSFGQIQQRLANEYDWQIGANTIQKLYYSERGRVYDTYGDVGNDVEEESVTEEILEAVEGGDAMRAAAEEGADLGIAGNQDTD